jgi:transposase
VLVVHSPAHGERQGKGLDHRLTQAETKIRALTPARGRGKRQITAEAEKVRYQITDITRDEERIGDLKARFGWKAFVTNAPATRLSLADAVLCYRHEYRIERIFNRLKSRLHIAPMFVSREDQIQGLTYLLTLGVRVLTMRDLPCGAPYNRIRPHSRGCTRKTATRGAISPPLSASSGPFLR